MSSLSNNHPVIDEGDYYTEINGYQVPQNIRHRFRSTITAELLLDKDKVERDKNDLEYVNIKQNIPIYRRPQTTFSSSNPDYTKISNDLRCTVAHGYPVQRSSHSKTIHNQDIFKSHQDDQQSNLYRRKKDWLARWTEANIIRDRLYKNILEAQKKTTQ
ncbi:unnamed protein product [Rotaria sp. Silwood1]|nr:unnamed protein product [Rotaria sp. Silwood1]CAF1302750.1 unnamed protein product [Rotaria sp. Silwood1]CAF1304574.1 unnamed protein product [Rotaria sp. Silwood1]CAF3494609.1 unnamed protein product [Rotaria sp. Silwood1]CAF3549732.1 unnamed protein product [Rotaria sp. Silwood1]